VASGAHPLGGQDLLYQLEQALVRNAADLALFFVYDRPSRATERPGLARTYFAQRCVSDEQLDLMIDAFRSVGAYVELFEGERPFMSALADGRIQRMEQGLKVAYNGIGWGIAFDGFKPGRKALIPLVADSYSLVCVNSDPYACALTVHKFHSFLVLAALGVQTPRTWHYRPPQGWIGGFPPPDTRVIAKSTYEAWSVGVTEESVFDVDESCEARVATIAESIGQAVTVQEFIPGREVCVPVISCPERVVTPPMEAVMARAPGDPNAVMTIDDNLRKGAVSHRPFEGSAALMERIRKSALAVFEIFDLQGLTRIDFRVDEHERPWVFDVAIDPGVGLKSSAFRSLAELGFDHAGFLRTAVAATLVTEGRLRR
jgi:D-alanine-D-alanine ligase